MARERSWRGVFLGTVRVRGAMGGSSMNWKTRVANASDRSHYALTSAGRATRRWAMESQVEIPSVGGGVPLFGNLFELRRDRLAVLGRAAARGDLTLARLGPVPVALASSAELAHQILTEQADAFKKSPGLARFARPMLGEGLLTSEDDLHARQRRLLAPAFQHRRIAAYGAAMVALAEHAAAGFSDGATVDLAEEMMRLTLAIVGRTLFDADLTGEARVVGDALTRAMQSVVESTTAIPWPQSWPLPRYRRGRRAVADLDAVVYRLIRDRRAEGGDRGDVLSVLLAARDEQDGLGMDDRQVRDEVMTLMLAGHETTANALAWTVALLGRHPDEEAALRAEVRAVLDGRPPTVEDLPRMPALRCAVQEAMRLYPPAFVVGRQARRPVTLGAHRLPEGAIVMVNIFGIHRRADYFPAPLSYRPARFRDEKALARGTYLPFGGGPRICIGNHFALMEAQLILAVLLSRVRFEPLSPSLPRPEPLMTLRPHGGLPTKVTRLAD
jgi:cytochrome P450